MFVRGWVDFAVVLIVLDCGGFVVGFCCGYCLTGWCGGRLRGNYFMMVVYRLGFCVY